MDCSAVAFALLAANPIGGLSVAIPFAIFKLHYSSWVVFAAGVPLAYTQVVAVDLGFDALSRMSWWRRLVERSRNRTVERLVASRGSFLATAVFSPFIGPWIVMALMRYAQIPHRKVALPLLVGISWTCAATLAACVFLPRLFTH